MTTERVQTAISTTCPYCGQPIGVTERSRIERVERQRLHEATEEAVEAQMAEAKAALLTAELHAKELEETLDAKVNEQLEIEKAAIEARAQEQIEQAQKELERLKREQDERLEQEKLRVENELHKDLHDKDKKLELANKTIDTLKKQIEGKTAYELGGIQEEELVELLRGEFPRDRIQRITGRAGADVEHEVIHEGDKCGLIIYESKNVQGWQNEFIAKLHRDKLDLGAAYAILVSTAFPGKQREFCLEDGICVVNPRLVKHLVCVIRQSLVDLHLQSRSGEERGFKLEQLMIFLSSPDFKNKMLAVFRAIDKLETLQVKERKSHDKTWGEQVVALRAIRNSSSDVQNEINAILAGR